MKKFLPILSNLLQVIQVEKELDKTEYKLASTTDYEPDLISTHETIPSTPHEKIPNGGDVNEGIRATRIWNFSVGA